MMKMEYGKMFNNTKKLFRFLLRRSYLNLFWWLGGIFGLTFIITKTFSGFYTTPEELLGIIETMKNPAMTFMVGPGYGLYNYTIGAMIAHQMLLFTAVSVSIMSILIVIRYTKTDEEEGLIEMIKSLPVGRVSNLIAVILVMLLFNLFLVLIIGFGLPLLKIESVNLSGSLLYGAILGSVGLFFVSLTCLLVQLINDSKKVMMVSFSLLGLFYLIRGFGDLGLETLSLFSPLGLILRTEVYVNNYWEPLLILLIISLTLIIISLYLNSILDLNAGFISLEFKYKETSLKNLFSLIIKLEKIMIISWLIGIFLLSVSYGAVFGDIETFFQSNEIYQKLLPMIKGASFEEQFLVIINAVLAMIGTIPLLIMIFKINSEEKKGYLEHLLSKPLSRCRVLINYLIITIIFSLLILLMSSWGLYLPLSLIMIKSFSFFTIFLSFLVYLPALFLMIGLSIFFLGSFPHKKIFMWLYLGFSFIVIYFKELLKIPKWVLKLSPFGHISLYPLEEINLFKSALLLIIGLIFIMIGLFNYHKRDINLV